jgi:hypothetical protein
LEVSKSTKINPIEQDLHPPTSRTVVIDENIVFCNRIRTELLEMVEMFRAFDAILMIQSLNRGALPAVSNQPQEKTSWPRANVDLPPMATRLILLSGKGPVGVPGAIPARTPGLLSIGLEKWCSHQGGSAERVAFVERLEHAAGADGRLILDRKCLCGTDERASIGTL